MAKKGISVVYRYRFSQFLLFLSLFVYFVAGGWFVQEVLMPLTGEWWINAVHLRRKDSTIASIVGILILFPMYCLVRRVQGKPMSVSEERFTFDGESLLIVMYGLSLVYALSTLFYRMLIV